jgi:hypothetical protein
VKRSSLKAVPETRLGPLTYEQADRLARGIRDSADQDEWLLGALMLFAREIIDHCQDATHVETMAMVLENTLYTVTSDFDRAQEQFIEARRAEFLKGSGGQ